MELNTYAILMKDLHLLHHSMQEEVGLEYKHLPYNIYMRKANLETTYGLPQIYIQTYADTLELNFTFIDTKNVTLY